MTHNPACETVRCGCGNPRCGECEGMCNCDTVSRVHDPLCPVLYGKAHPLWKAAAPLSDLLCECDLIRRIRADEREIKPTGYEEGASSYSMGYAVALRDAVEAVNGLPSANYMPHPGYTDDQPALWREQVVAAIEALNE